MVILGFTEVTLFCLQYCGTWILAINLKEGGGVIKIYNNLIGIVRRWVYRISVFYLQSCSRLRLR